jgi:UDP-glucose 4-epimerase
MVRNVKTVVTGGAGFIGANLCRALASAGVGPVVALDDLSTGSADNLAGLESAVTMVKGSILDAGLVDEVVDGAGAVVHLAARPSVPRSLEDPVASHDVNATGTVNVLEAVRHRGRPHLIVASSSSVYGANPEIPKHEGMAPMPVSPYAASKLATESYALAFASSFGLDVLAFRFFNVFGPLQPAGHAYAAVIPAFVSAAVAGRPLTVHGDGRQTRDFTFVDSVTSVLTDAVHRRVTSPMPVNLAFGSRHSMLDVIEVLERILGRSLERDHTEPRPGDVRDSQADNNELLGLFPATQPVSFEVGLARTVAWFNRQC